MSQKYHVDCPHCRTKCEIPDSLFGQPIACPVCQQTFVVGKPAAMTPPIQTPQMAAPPAPQASAPPAPAPRPPVVPQQPAAPLRQPAAQGSFIIEETASPPPNRSTISKKPAKDFKLNPMMIGGGAAAAAVVLLVIVVISMGSSEPESKPAPKIAKTENRVPEKAREKAQSKSRSENSQATAKSPTAASTQASNADAATEPAKPAAAAGSPPKSLAFDDAAFLGPDVLGVFVVRPKQLADWSTYRVLKNSQGFFPKDYLDAKQAIGLQPEHVSRLTLVFTKQTVEAMPRWPSARWEIALSEGQMPAIIITMAIPRRISIDFMNETQKEPFAGQTLLTNGQAAVCLLGDKLVIGSLSDVKMLVQTKMETTQASNPFENLKTDSDLTAFFRMDQFKDALKVPIQGLAALESASVVQSLEAHLHLSGQSGETMMDIIATASDAQTAKSVFEQIQPVVEQTKKTLLKSPPPDLNDQHQLFRQIVESTSIGLNGTRIAIQNKIPNDFDELPDALQPTIRKAELAAEDTNRRNVLKQFGLAFWNFESAYRAFPAAGGTGVKGGSSGLSWRVYLLPYTDQTALYSEFNLKEPWDSEHNKKLIPKMPAIFKTPGVTDPEKTALHVFTGPSALFANDRAPTMGSMKDTDSQILMVEAGPETAEIWTKPGGLNFDPKDPIKALGTLPETGFRALLVSGRTVVIPASTDKKALLNMIQLQERK